MISTSWSRISASWPIGSAAPEHPRPVTIQSILRFPDRRLRSPAAPVGAFDDDLRALAADLADTMAAAPGIGITAPHIGVLLRVVVIGLPGEDLRIYVNPKILDTADERVRHLEGSVSMPGVTDEVERAARVRIGYQALDGGERVEESDGLLAICLQHEIDQLDGIFWLDRLSRLRRDRLIKRFEKLNRA
jgi:peptide deformylase